MDLSKRRKWHKEYNARLKKAVFDILGRRCVTCGFNDERALQIDHVKGGGSEERKTKGGRYIYSIVLKNIADGKKDYQILCTNCNWIKRAENGECRKRI
jgi:hypothetical protein